MPAWKRWTGEERTAMRSAYESGGSMKAIAKALGCSPHCVSLVLRRDGVSLRSRNQYSRSYEADHRYFRSVDNPTQAYWLGFLMADGCVGNDDRVTVRLAVRDADHLEQLRSDLRADHPVRRYSAAAEFTITSPMMAIDLARYGVTPRKTLREKLPHLEPSLAPHFWRGMVDGDGCLYRPTHGKQTGRLTLALCGGLPIVEAFASLCRAMTGARAMVYFGDGVWYVRLNGKRAQVVADWLYAGAGPRLERKAIRAGGEGSSGRQPIDDETALVEAGTIPCPLVGIR